MTSAFVLCLTLFASLAIAAADASAKRYKILVFSPTNSRSHVISNARIADTLAKAGFDVLLLEAEFAVKTSETTTAKHARRKVIGGFDAEILGRAAGGLTVDAFAENRPMLANRHVYGEYYKAFTHQCDQFLKRKDVLEELRAEKFDIIISEQLHLCGTGLKHVLNIPTHILVNSCPVMEHVAWIMGIPLAQSYVPAVADVDVSDTMPYYERVLNLIESMGTLYIYMDMTASVTRTYRKHFGPQFPDVADIVRESPLVFVSVDELVDFPRPTLHNVVYIGGLGMSIESHALSEPYKAEMERGKNGVVFFSFGSNTNTNQMPKNFKQNLFSAFAKLTDYHFIMKIDKGDTFSEALAENSSNVFTTNWAPQTDLLAHPRMKAFITHGGYNSLLETARLGVPIIAMPFFVDQFRNARVAERNGWGISFEKTKLLHGHEEFLEALRRILEDPRFEENAKRTKHLLATKPFSAEERLVKYTQFVADNGGQLPELQIQGRRLSFIVYHNLDIYIPLVVTSLALLYWTIRLLLLVVRWLLRPFTARKLKTA